MCFSYIASYKWDESLQDPQTDGKAHCTSSYRQSRSSNAVISLINHLLRNNSDISCQVNAARGHDETRLLSCGSLSCLYWCWQRDKVSTFPVGKHLSCWTCSCKLPHKLLWPLIQHASSSAIPCSSQWIHASTSQQNENISPTTHL